MFATHLPTYISADRRSTCNIRTRRRTDRPTYHQTYTYMPLPTCLPTCVKRVKQTYILHIQTYRRTGRLYRQTYIPCQHIPIHLLQIVTGHLNLHTFDFWYFGSGLTPYHTPIYPPVQVPTFILTYVQADMQPSYRHTGMQRQPHVPNSRTHIPTPHIHRPSGIQAYR